MQIYRLSALSDNYMFLLHDEATNTAAIVDPAEAEPVLRQLDQLGAELTIIFNTHHHVDHIGGNRELLERFPDAEVYAGAEDTGRIPDQRYFLTQGDRVEFAGRPGEVYFVPGHTRAHIAYYFPPQQPDQPGELFCGDTLFAGGCGRLFEGTAEQMVISLAKLRSLPDNTRVWCGHEYTLNNLKFALTVDEENQELRSRFQQVTTARQKNEATIPSMLGLEKATNPFLRWDRPAIQAIANSQDPVQTFAHIRGLKDRF